MYNVTFHGRKVIRQMTWGEWRDLDRETQREIITDELHDLVDIDVADDET